MIFIFSIIVGTYKSLLATNDKSNFHWPEQKRELADSPESSGKLASDTVGSRYLEMFSVICLPFA